jgi:hypothetical protein
MIFCKSEKSIPLFIVYIADIARHTGPDKLKNKAFLISIEGSEAATVSKIPGINRIRKKQ